MAAALLRSISSGGRAGAALVSLLPPTRGVFRGEGHRAVLCCALERFKRDNARYVLLAEVLSKSKVLLLGEVAAPLHAENAQPPGELWLGLESRHGTPRKR